MLIREKNYSTLPEKVDVFIIGGGINGLGIARECSLQGLSVVCVDIKDFSSGTSSASSKLAHGGLRYLEQGEFKLVLESCHERERLIKNAPRLVKPLTFLLPIYQDSPFTPFKIKIGLTVYDALSFFKTTQPHQMLSKEEVLDREPWLDDDGLVGGALYTDAQMDDARLAIETGLQAESFGATILNYITITGIEKHDDLYHIQLHDNLNESKQKHMVKAKLIVNAGGPWSDTIQALLKPESPTIRPSKGVHIITKRISQQHAVLLTSKSDNRVYFVIPWNEYSLIGTTDTDYTGSPDEVDITEEDIHYLLHETNQFFPKVYLKKSDIISTFAGLRPLVKTTEENVGSVSREEKIHVKNNVLTLTGGKYTTYRAISEKVCKKILSIFKKKHNGQHTKELPLFENPQSSSLTFQVDHSLCTISEELQQELIRKYGSQYNKIIDICIGDKTALERLPSSNILRAEVIFCIRHEHARRIEDFMRRRSDLMLREGNGLDVLDDVAHCFASELNWTDSQRNDEIRSYAERVQQMQHYFA